MYRGILPHGYTVRPSQPGDLEEMLVLANACEMKLIGVAETTIQDMQQSWHAPDFDLERDSWVIRSPEGSLVAWAKLEHKELAQLNVEAHVHPEYGGRVLGTYLLHAAEKRAREFVASAPPNARGVLIAVEESTNKAGGHLLERNGFQLVRHFWRMAIEMQEAPPEPTWPEGLTLRTMAPGMERAIFDADEEIFRDHWGYIPDIYEEWSYWLIEYEGFDPSLWFLLMDGEQIAAISLCESRPGSVPWIRSLGVQRPWRRKGLALSLLQHSFREFYKRGLHTVCLTVDSQSLTGATRLYERAGMHMTRQRDRYEKELQAGREESIQGVAG